MKRFTWLLMLGVVLLGAEGASAATYYIDFANGLNSNSGLSTSMPWKHAPGMQGCTATCVTTVPKPGDRFILKGGVTWPNSVFTWFWQWNGTSAARIYVGVDQTFFSGASWTRPILNAGGSLAGSGNIMVQVNADYVTFDNFEFTGMIVLSPPVFGGNTAIKWGVSIFPIMSMCYFHGWTENTTDDVLIMTAFATQNPPLNTGAIVENNVFDGFDSPLAQTDPNCTGVCQGSGQAIFGAVPILRFNTFRNVSNGFVGSAGQAYGNLFEKIRDSIGTNEQHENAFESNSDISGALIYNNTIRTVKAGVTLWVNPQLGDTTKVFNNLLYDTTAGNVFNVGTDNVGDPRGSIEIYNNTIECGPDANPTFVCISLGSSLNQINPATILNNHLITSNVTPIRPDNVGTLIASNQVIQAKTQANAQGYTLANRFAPGPASNSRITVGPGQNLTSLSILQLQSDIRGQQRPSTGNWNFGAYQVPQPPANLRPPSN